MSILRVAFLSSAALELFSTMAIAVIAVYLGLGLLGFIHAGFSVHITLQQALFILLITPEFYAPLRQLGVFYHARAEAIAAATDILKFEPEKKEISTNDHAIIFSEKKMSLAIQNLSFEYQTEKKIKEKTKKKKLKQKKKKISTNDPVIFFFKKKMSLAIQNLSFEYQTEKKI